MIIIIILKPNSGIDPGQSPGHWLRSESLVEARVTGQLTRFSVRIKIIIIIVLKPDSGVNLGQGPGHK
jgi:hypothetical protein